MKIKLKPLLSTILLVIVVVIVAFHNSNSMEGNGIHKNVSVMPSTGGENDFDDLTNNSSGGNFNSNENDLTNFKPIMQKTTALLGEEDLVIMDYSGVLHLSNQSKITLKYDSSIANASFKVKSDKIFLFIQPLKSTTFIVNVYYSGKLIGYVVVDVVDYKLVNVSHSFTVEVEPYTYIDKMFEFTVKNEYNVPKDVIVKVYNPFQHLSVSVTPAHIMLNPNETGVIQVKVKGVVEEYSGNVVLSIDGVERYITIKTHPLIVSAKLLDNTVYAGSDNVLTLIISSNSEEDFYMYINGQYFKTIHLTKGDNKVNIPYKIPIPKNGSCYLSLLNQYGTLKIELKNPYKSLEYTFNLNLLTNNPVDIIINNPVLTFYNSTSASTFIIFKNNNNYKLSLTPHFFICDEPNQTISTCEDASKDYIISFYELTGQEIGKVTLEKYQQRIYTLLVKPARLYYEDFTKYIVISFTAEKTINNETISTPFDKMIQLKLENKVNVVMANIDINYQYDENTGGFVKTIISSPVELPIKNVTITYWVKGYDGDDFKEVRPKTTLIVPDFQEEYVLNIALDKNYKFFIYYIEVKGDTIENTKLYYLYSDGRVFSS